MLLKILLAPSRPTHGQLHRSPHPARIRGVLGALVERHDDVRSQADLRRHGTLRTEKVRRAIEVRPERHSLLIELAQLAKAEYLKSPGIRQKRPVPRHKAMQPAHPPDDLHTRPQIQVISISKDDLRSKFLNNVLRHALYGRDGSHRHEHRRVDHGMRSRQPPHPPPAADLVYLKVNGHVLGF